MKDAGTWPTIDYKKCTEYNQQDPLVQNVNLLQSMKSISVISSIFFYLPNKYEYFILK